MILFYTTPSGKPCREDPDSPWSDVTVGRTSPTPVAMMVYDEHGVPVFETTRMPYSKAKAKAYGKGPRAVVWPPYPPGTGTDPVARTNLMVAHWGAFANRLLRNYTRKYMFKFWKIDKRRRAIIVRENMARRTLIRANPQYGPFRPTDIHECSRDSDDEPTISVAPAASDVPTAAPGRLHSQLPGLIELWMFSMHQALLGFRIPGTLVLET